MRASRAVAARSQVHRTLAAAATTSPSPPARTDHHRTRHPALVHAHRDAPPTLPWLSRVARACAAAAGCDRAGLVFHTKNLMTHAAPRNGQPAKLASSRSHSAAVVALLRGAAAKAYGARAAQRRDPGVVSLRVERQGALVEIDVALRDVRGLADEAAAYRALLATAEEVEAPAPAQALFSPVLSPPILEEAPVPANAPAPAPSEADEDLDVLEAVSILVEKGKRSRRVLGPDHPLTVEVLGQLEQALSPTSPFSPSSLAPAPAPPLTVDDV